MIELYKGKYVEVRVVHKRNGGIAFGLFRPGSLKFDEFGSAEFANLVAKYIDEHGGSYDSTWRKKAKQYARVELERQIDIAREERDARKELERENQT